MSNQKKKLVVLGGAESGIGAALLAQAKGFEVFLSDQSLLADPFRQELQSHGIEFEEGRHSTEQILEADEVVKSPGIPEKAPVIQKLRAKGVPIVSEIEFASRYTHSPVVAITGSNGKTTTTLLIHHLFTQAGIKAGLGGNVGNSFAKPVIEDAYDWYILEVSSFQLDDCYLFRPHIALLLNITPDHLDRYHYRFELYAEAKFRIVQQQQPSDFFIYYQDNQAIKERLNRHIPSIHLPISTASPEVTGFVSDKGPISRFGGEEVAFPYGDLPLKGEHNALNTLSAILACQAAGISAEAIREGLKTFKGAPHRLEEVGNMNGVRFINDSKATNVDSVYYALGSFEAPLVLIAGGIDKGNDYTQIESLVRDKVKLLICLGKDKQPLLQFFTGKVPAIRETQDIQQAVKWGLEALQSSGVVLLSPACASFDLFKNYEDRGNQFRQAVQELMGH
jgi:UDP-N-acetylmuramoylalanine--D-glutamate ligase